MKWWLTLRHWISWAVNNKGQMNDMTMNDDNMIWQWDETVSQVNHQRISPEEEKIKEDKIEEKDRS